MTLSAGYEIILNDTTSDETAASLFAPVGFTNWHSARRTLQRLAGYPLVKTDLVECLPYLLAELGKSAGPDAVLVNLERFCANSPKPGEFFQYLASHPHAIQVMVTLFSSSQFLTEIILRHPEYMQLLADAVQQPKPQTSSQFYQSLCYPSSARQDPLQQLDSLRLRQRWEMLHIGACDLLGLYDLATVTTQLSNLADSLIHACLDISVQQLEPVLDRSHAPTSRFSILAMGKLGGQELNYSSDIDLLFIASSTLDYYRRLGERLIDALANVTDEGFLYRVDMRLRPWGRVGALVPTRDSYLAYLKQGAHLWEKQALLKARFVAGDALMASDFLQNANVLVYDTDTNTVRSEVFAMKQRTESFLRQKGREWGEVKLGEGSIRDIEFIVQFLQLAYGKKQPEIRSRNTLEALKRLVKYQLLNFEDYRYLEEGYVFLRTIEHHLQMMHYRQTNTLPTDPLALLNLSLRLGFQGENAGGLFTNRYRQHSTAIRSIYLKYMGAQPMDPSGEAVLHNPEVRRHIERMDPSYESTFSPADISRHAALADLLDEDHLVELDAVALEDNRWRVTIVAFDYPGELALICGLMFVYGLDIHDGNAFTYEPITSAYPSQKSPDQARKLVDVFTISPSNPISNSLWTNYAADLTALLQLTREGERQEARGLLARRTASILRGGKGIVPPLYPIDISLDNETSSRYTVLHITATDTIGFLYELSNALAFNQVYIARVEIDTKGDRIHDILYVTDASGNKITRADKQRELRAATVLIKHFTHLLPLSPDPETAMVHFHEFTGELFLRPNWPDELASLERPEVLGALAQLLGVSDFLWHDFLRMQHTNLFPVVSKVGTMTTAKTPTQLQAELKSAIEALPGDNLQVNDPASWHTTLNVFKDREMFRIDMRHILGFTQEFWDFSDELTDLAEVVVNAAVAKIYKDLNKVYGVPLLENTSPSVISVCALGKCGGRELGFASDIELMFVYAGNGKTSGSEVITTAEFYEKLVESFISAIHARREGIFEVDLQLRPYGKAGSLAVSFEAFRRYFNPGGPAWAYERQALVRLRPITGDERLGQEIAKLRDAFLYTGIPFDVTSMRAMRERQIRHLVKGGTFNPKYSPGGLVDLEYLVQALQITNGAENPGLRTTNTRQAMAALAAAGILSPDDYTLLRKAYTFLRWLIDSLRMVAGNAKDLVVPPEDSEAFVYLARRLRYEGDQEKLHEDLLRFTTAVQNINHRLLDRPQP